MGGWPYARPSSHSSDPLGVGDFGGALLCWLHRRLHHHLVPASMAAITNRMERGEEGLTVASSTSPNERDGCDDEEWKGEDEFEGALHGERRKLSILASALPSI